ncbi:MAG: hypothetical protein KGJ36_01700 [Acidobacteriota bacterium]|nr:hypothetical protein [Acidobacteriota bacterium]
MVRALSHLAVNVHAGSPLPAARAVVVGVPAALALLYWWVTHRRGRP